MEASLFRYIWRHSRRDQLMILVTVIAAQVFYFLSLNLPKTIVNDAIQGAPFKKHPTVNFLHIDLPLPDFLGGGSLHMFDGFALSQVPYLFAVSCSFLLMVMINNGFKFRINTQKGRMGERMLRRLRYELFDRVVRFPASHFRKVKQAEIATMIKDEVEPLGGFIGDAYVQPFFLGGQALTALFFILTQSFWLGAVAVSVLAVQAFVIPRLRRRVLVLGKARQLTARQLAGRIAEVVDGSAEIHTNATSNYERADISNRLGTIFGIRFELYQRKFAVKFLNNVLAQTTPFLFYLIGGYLAITGHMDVGGVVAAIIAYKDLPGPVKELIDWDQQRQDVQIKYEQVIEQFTPDGMLAPELQQPLKEPPPHLEGEVVASNITMTDEAGSRLLDGASFKFPLDAHVALVGPPTGGKDAIAHVVARLARPNTGSLTVGGRDVFAMPEEITGSRIGYVGQDVYLFPHSVRDNILYSLKRKPLRAAILDEQARQVRERDVMETLRSGNPDLDPFADWIDYEAAGVDDADALDGKVLEVLKLVELDNDIYYFGLRGTLDPDQRPEAAAAIMQARARLRERLADPSVAGLVEPFDRERYVRNMSVAENLLFGTPRDAAFAPERIADNPLVLAALDTLGLTEALTEMGYDIAETMVELFADLPPGHPFFEQFSFIAAEDLPEFRLLLSRRGKSTIASMGVPDRSRLMALVFPYIEARHRLGLIDDAMEARLLEARHALQRILQEAGSDAVEPYDRRRYTRSATLQDNILFGRLVYGQAQAGDRIGALITEVLENLELGPTVVRVGLDFMVGNGGKRLTAAQRQKVGLARSLVKQPDLLVINEAMAVLDAATQARLLDRILEMRQGKGVLWTLSHGRMAEHFDIVLVARDGRIAAQGLYQDLNKPDTAVGQILAAQ
jgi:putative ABC transport system ATP-binding protein